MRDLTVLGIETSCDETSAAVVKNGREVLSNVINSQVKIHEKFGGVVPELASRNHVDNINIIVKEALKQANIKFEDIDLVTCTSGPGLVGALLVGISYAKGLSFALNKPLLGVNHIEGHVAGNYITHKELEPPFLCLIISGGHTHLVYVKDYTEFEIMGKTRDDAIGEAYDKVARIIGLGYPGGPKIDKLALEGTPNIRLPKSNVGNLDFSFSGIKTSILNMYNKKSGMSVENSRSNSKPVTDSKDNENDMINKADLCISFEKISTEMLIENTLKALKQLSLNTVALAGGVSANSYIRKAFKELKDINVYYPEMQYCTDNAAMIASAGYYRFINGEVSDLSLNAVPNLKLK